MGCWIKKFPRVFLRARSTLSFCFSLWLMFVQKQVKYDLSHTHSAGNCLVMAFLLAIVNGVGASALCAGIIWMCTRPLPGILLLLISVSSDFVSLHVAAHVFVCV